MGEKVLFRWAAPRLAPGGADSPNTSHRPPRSFSPFPPRRVVTCRGWQAHFAHRRCCPASSRAQPTLILPFEACLKVRAESIELSKTDSLPNLAHYVKVKVDVVVGVQDARERFARGIKVPQICTRVPAADGALTFFVYGPLIVCITRVRDEQASLRGEQASMARAAGGQHAIHHVDSEAYVIRELFWFADAHQVARLVRGQARSRSLRHRARGFVRLADCESTDCVAGKIESDKGVGIFVAQPFVCAALHDSEKCLPSGI